MSESKVFVGDIGTVIEMTVTNQDDAVVDLSTATTKQIILKKPDGTKLTKTASFVTDGTDGKLSYTTASGDIDQSGPWQLQAYVVLSGGSWHTTKAEMEVSPVL